MTGLAKAFAARLCSSASLALLLLLIPFEWNANAGEATTRSLSERWRDVKLTETGRDTHPCVYMTPADVELAKRNIERFQWARDCADTIIRRADGVVGRDPEWIRENCPGKAAPFGYGETGCPICATTYPAWGNADCSFDRPRTVTCPNGHVLPDDDHPDSGTGYLAPDGRRHWFVAVYNTWVVETYQKWCHWLSYAYSITGEEKYAATCAVVLDALAEIYPSCDKGPWDWWWDCSGRLSRPGYQASRVLITLVDYYDRIHNSSSLDGPSFVDGLTRRQNIEENMLKNGAAYCYEQSLAGGVNNGEADYVRGCLAVGCLLGIEAYVDWAVEGPYGIRALINNNADRDGRYVETSLGYARSCRTLYLTFSEPLINYRSDKYPNGLNLYDDDTFRSFYILPILSMDCVGHWPRYGDWSPDTDRIDPQERSFDPLDCLYAERIYARTSRPEVKQAFGSLIAYLAHGDVERLRARAADREWLLFHSDGIPQGDASLPDDLERRVSATSLMGQKGIAILRTLPGEHAQACLLRFGPVLNHGHLDDLNINYYGLGYELTYDIGYGNGVTNTQKGWARQTASHQLVLVDELPQQSGTEMDDSGGSLHLFAGMPGLQVVDADADNVYRSTGVTTYRRFVALVGDGPGSYLLDIFAVDGGSRHDYMAHALSNEIEFHGVILGEREPGSVAGPEYDWGTRQQNDGYISGVPRSPAWIPPPGNGLGFMMHPRRGTSEGPWSATWRLPDGQSRLRMTVLPEGADEIINAWAPGIYPPRPKAEHVIVRRRSDGGPLQSTFLTLREPFEGSPTIERAERLATTDGASALAVHHRDGQTDRFVYAGTPARAVSAGEITLDGCFGLLRAADGRPLGAHLIGKSMRSPGFGIELARPGYTGKVVRVDYEKNWVYVDEALPTDGRLDHQVVAYANPAYTRNTAYTIHRVFQDGDLSVIDLGTQRTVLGQGTLDSDPPSGTEMTSATQHDYARGLTRQGVRFFDGKMLRSVDGEHETRIVRARYGQPFELTVESTAGFEAGDTFHYLDLYPGDNFVVHNWAAVNVDEAGQPHVTATDDVTVTIDGRVHEVSWVSATE